MKKLLTILLFAIPVLASPPPKPNTIPPPFPFYMTTAGNAEIGDFQGVPRTQYCQDIQAQCVLMAGYYNGVPLAVSVASDGTLNTSGGSPQQYCLNCVPVAGNYNGSPVALKVDQNGNVQIAGGGGGGSPGGSNTQVQFNDSGSFGGAVGWTWNKTLQLMALARGSTDTPQGQFNVMGTGLATNCIGYGAPCLNYFSTPTTPTSGGTAISVMTTGLSPAVGSGRKAVGYIAQFDNGTTTYGSLGDNNAVATCGIDLEINAEIGAMTLSDCTSETISTSVNAQLTFGSDQVRGNSIPGSISLLGSPYSSATFTMGMVDTVGGVVGGVITVDDGSGNIILTPKSGSHVKFPGTSSGTTAFAFPATGGGTVTFPPGSGTLCYTSTCSGAVSSVFGRIGAVAAAANDYNFNQLAGQNTYAQFPTPSAVGDVICSTTGPVYAECTSGRIVTNETGSGTILTFAQSDNSNMHTQLNASASAYGLPIVSSLSTGWATTLFNLGAGTVTVNITSSTATVCGASTCATAQTSFTVTTAQFALIQSNSSGYFVKVW